MAPKKGGFYAVRVGHKPGVYKTWPEAEAQVKGFLGCVHKKFATLQEAEAFAQPLREPGQQTLKSQEPYLNKRAREQPSSASGSGSKGGDAAPPVKKARKSLGDERVFGKEGRRVYCDGSSRGNGQKGAVAGIGVFWSHEVGAPNLSERLPGSLQTNNRAEMYAVARILESDPTPHLPLTICTDSQYTISVFKEWVPGWRKRNWKTSGGTPVLNKDLILYVLSLISLRQPAKSTSPTANVSFQKVKAHVGIDGNEMADQLANNGALLPVTADVDFEAKTKENERKLKAKGLKEVQPEFEVYDIGDLWTDEELKEMASSQKF